MGLLGWFHTNFMHFQLDVPNLVLSCNEISQGNTVVTLFVYESLAAEVVMYRRENETILASSPPRDLRITY